MAGLPIYVDNVDGDDAKDGLTTATAVKTLAQAILATDFDSGSTIYIKATGVEYQTATGGELVDFYNKGFDDITIDRYPTDTGTNRPILSHTSDYAYSQTLITLDGDNFIIKNIHFKGKSVQNDGQADGLVKAVRDVPSLTIQDCIFDAIFTHQLLRFNNVSQDYSGITISRCYFSIADGYKEAIIYRAIGTDASAVLGDITVEYSVFKNFGQSIFYANREAGSTAIIDHNTFYECARPTGGVIAYLDMDEADAPVTFTNNIIYNSSAEGTTTGFDFITNDNAVLTAGHNAWHGIANHYDTYTDDGSDMDVEPEWPGCTNKEWTAAHIVMATYYAPIKDQSALVIGDSTGGTVGAIAVTLIGDESVIYDNSTTKAEADLDYYIVNSAFEDKMFSFSHGRGAQGSRFMYELEVTASRTRPTELRAIAIDWFVKRKLKRRYGG